MQDTFSEHDDQIENEEDIKDSWTDRINEAVISGSDWTTETILSQIEKGNIILDPEFQRRIAWNNKRKSKFIESLILGFPIPQIVLAQSMTDKGKYIVLDGKQRLTSIRSFIAKNDDKDYQQLKLSGLEIRDDLNGKAYSELENNPIHETDLSNFENQTIRTVVIKNWPDEGFLYHVFLRLNTGSVQLSPQELRQALHPGKFIRFATIESENLPALRDIFNNDKPDFRMRDAELLVRYYSFKYFIKEYKGNLKIFLDNSCMTLNNDWDSYEKIIKIDLSELQNAHDFLKDVFNENLYKKYTEDGFENRFNRAIFDIFVYYFSQKKVRNNIDKEQLERNYKKLCLENTEFRKSVEQTTKSIESTKIRLNEFGQMLNNISKDEIYIPQIDR